MDGNCKDVAIVGQHELAPDKLYVEWSPWGVVHTYVYFGPYFQEAATFQTGRCWSDRSDYKNAVEYINEWSTTGIEPDASRWKQNVYTT